MPKAEKGSLKDLGKRIKAKGLQKLKFYCQQCEKQCRDANGFKCHLTSESHLRQMKIFSEHAGSLMDQYSREFEQTFLEHLRLRHSTARVNANHVYQQVIQHKQHVHMNATIWATLSDFCQYLGKTGRCKVEETERGWYVTYIERDDSARIQQQEAQKKRQAAQQAAEVAAEQRIQEQRVRAAQEGAAPLAAATKLELPRDGAEREDAKIQLALRTAAAKKKKARGAGAVAKKGRSVFGGDSDDEDDEDDDDDQPLQKPPSNDDAAGKATIATSRTNPVTKRSQHAHDDKDNKAQMLKSNPKESSRKRPRMEEKPSVSKHNNNNNKPDEDNDEEPPWLYRGILVRIIHKKLAGGKYYRRKAVVDEVIDGFTAQVRLDGSDDDDDDLTGDILRLDQDDLETVAPKQVDQKVRIVRGAYRGKKAVVTSLDKKKYRADLQLKGKDDNAVVLERVDFDDFSMLV